MGRPSTVVQRIKPVLMSFIEQKRTLPQTSSGKVNVLQLCKDLHAMDARIKKDDAQHLYNCEELKNIVNIEATEQGLLPINHGASPGELEVVEQRLRRATKQGKEDAESALEANAGHQALLAELKETREEMEAIKLERDSAIARLRLIEDSGFLVYLDQPRDYRY